jgi:hypothetical protein
MGCITEFHFTVIQVKIAGLFAFAGDEHRVKSEARRWGPKEPPQLESFQRSLTGLLAQTRKCGVP